MKMKLTHLFKLRSLFLGAVFLVLLSGCDSEPAQPLRIGINVWPGYEALFIAREKGFYQDEGVDVKLIEYGSLSDARRAFERGQVDVMASTVIEVLLVREFSERRLQTFLVADFSDGADMILANSTIQNMEGLKGKKIGAEPASLGEFILMRALETAGLTLDDIVFIPMSHQEMEAPFRSGTVDAVVTYPPVSTLIERGGGANKVFDTSTIPLEIVDVLSADQEVLESRPEDIAGLVRAWDRSLKFMRESPEEANRLGARREGVTPEEFAQSFDGIQTTTTSEQGQAWRKNGTLIKSLKLADRVLRASGEIKGEDHTADCIAKIKFFDGESK